MKAGARPTPDPSHLVDQEISVAGDQPPSVDKTRSASGIPPLMPEVRRVLIGVVMMAAFAELGFAVINMSALPVYVMFNAHLSRVWVGIILTAFLLTEGLLKAPFGALGDRVGRKAMILIGPTVPLFVTLVIPHVHNAFGLVCLWVLCGIGAAALWPSCFSLIGDHVPEERRAAGMSLFNVAYILGIALGPALGGHINLWAYQHLHLSLAASKEASFYVASALFACTLIAALLLIPGGKTTHQATGPVEKVVEQGLKVSDFIRMLKRMPMALLMTFVTFLGMGFTMPYVKAYLIDPQGPFKMDEVTFGNTLIIPALIVGILSVPLGTLGDRIGKLKAVQIGMGLCAFAYLGLLLFPNRIALIMLGSLIGMGFVLAFPAWMAMVSASSDASQRGATVGAVATAQGLGAIVGAALSGFFFDMPALRLGPVELPPHCLPFILCGVMLTISFLLTLFAFHPKKGRVLA